MAPSWRRRAGNRMIGNHVCAFGACHLDPMEGLLGVGIYALLAHCGVRRRACAGSGSQVLRSPLSASPRDKDCCAANFRYRARRSEISRYLAASRNMRQQEVGCMSASCRDGVRAAGEGTIPVQRCRTPVPPPPAMESMSGVSALPSWLGTT
jgi:hypothetical protein